MIRKYCNEKLNSVKMYTYHIKEMLFVSNFKMHYVKFCIITSLFLLILLIGMLPFIISSKIGVLNQKQTRFTPDLRYILFWNQPMVKTLQEFQVKQIPEFKTGQKLFIEQNCSHFNCYISYNKNLLNGDQNNFDAVVFDVHDISKFMSNEFNSTRSRSQKFIFRSHDSSEKQPVCNPVYDDFFNWTWTYKLNSDIPHPFINIYDSSNKLVGPNITMDWVKNMNHSSTAKSKIVNKRKAVVWVVDKCRLKSKHKDFLKELRAELKGYNYSVDLLGPCGDKKCPGGKLSKCYKMVEKEYYFQIVLEDSMIEDYMTGKMVKALSSFTVPIVLGGVDYTRFLPPGAYINAQAFDFKKLGALVDYLIKNPTVYEYLFDWKNHYFYTTRHKNYVCDLCAKLNENRDFYENHANFRQWWNPDYKDVCERMHLYRIFNP